MATGGTTVVLDSAAMSMNTSNATTCLMFDGDQHLCDLLIGLKRFIASLSMIGCLAVIFAIWLFRKYLVFIQRLILNLSLAGFFQSIFFITGDQYQAGSLCTFQAWGLSFFAWAVLIWNSCITFNLYLTAIKSIKTDKFEWLYHIISWAVSFVIACLPLFGNHYGPAGMWCWIVDNWGWRFGTFYLPLVLSFIAMFAAYTYISVMVKRQSQTWEGLYDPDAERKKQLLREDLKPLRWYPLAYLLTSLFPLINRIQNAISSKPVFALTLLQVLTNPLYGFTLAMVFFADKEIRSQLSISKIKVALLNRSHVTEIREYPVSYGPPGESDDPPKFSGISYSKIQ